MQKRTTRCDDDKGRKADRTLTEQGVDKAEQCFNVENLTDPDNTELYHHINQALKAHVHHEARCGLRGARTARSSSWTSSPAV